MIYLNNDCTDFMFLVVMLCVTYSFTKFSLIVFNVSLAFKLSLVFVEIYVYMF